MKRYLTNLKRAIAYFKQGWTSYDWDYAYFESDIAFKLKRMRNCFHENQIAEKDPQTVREIDVALDLLETLKLWEEVSAEMHHILSQKCGIEMKYVPVEIAGRKYTKLDWISNNGSDVAAYREASMKQVKYREEEYYKHKAKTFKFIADNMGKWWN